MTAAHTTAMGLKREPKRAWIFYDGDCQFCTATAARFAPILGRRHFNLMSLQTPWVQQRLGLNPGEPLTEMKLLAEDGRIFGGADALLRIARKIWWAWPLVVLAQISGAKFLFRTAYERFAANRHCLNGICFLPQKSVRRNITTTFFEMP
ncbi:MAG TPA: DUF393 domain-containing protein [Candidatus Aquilonibacter sp.]|nr:DUF393 domain-containing protein [Candidatus Aquilonibacter sp.]